MQKHFYLILSFLFLVFFSYAQEPVFTQVGQQETYEEQIENIFKELDLAKVPSGILADYGLSTIDLDIFDGKRNIRVNFGEWRRLYAALCRGAVKKQHKLPLFKTWEDKLYEYHIFGINFSLIHNKLI